MKQPLAPVLVVVTVLLAAPLAGCGEATAPPGEEAAAPSRPADPPTAAGAPAVTLHLDRGDVELVPWTYCWETTCADGAPPRDLPDVGSPAEVAFSFPAEDWEFTATFTEHGVEQCPRRVRVPVSPSADGRWVLEPAGPAGRWDVELFGRGEGQGDVVTSFGWNTPRDGTVPAAATGSAGVLAEHDGGLDSYGVEVSVADLAAHPRSGTATVTVASADGTSLAIPTKLQRPCWSEGALSFSAPAAAGRRATSLGPGPFGYSVELVLDGTTYTGTGEWPTGETEDLAPHVPLTWTPPLPAYTG